MVDGRFVLQADGNGRWSVFDTEKHAAAIVHGRTLVRISQAEAKDAATLLNMIAGIQREGPSQFVAVQSEAQRFLLPIR